MRITQRLPPQKFLTKHFLLPAVLCLASVTALWLGTSPSALAGMIQLSQPTLSLPDQVQAQRGGTVTLPVTFNSGGHAIASTVFSVDYDQTWLTFDPTDSNGDGIPDDITFSTPPAFTPQVAFNPADTDGELDFVIADFAPPLASLPSGIIVSITFAVGTPPATLGAAVNFSQSPAASFGNTAGQSVPGTTDNGSVLIVVPTSTPSTYIFIPFSLLPSYVPATWYHLPVESAPVIPHPVGDPPHVPAIDIHDVQLDVPVAGAGEDDPGPIGGNRRFGVIGAVVGQLLQIRPIGSGGVDLEMAQRPHISAGMIGRLGAGRIVLEGRAVKDAAVVVVEVSAGGASLTIRHPPQARAVDVDDILLVAAFAHFVLPLENQLPARLRKIRLGVVAAEGELADVLQMVLARLGLDGRTDGRADGLWCGSSAAARCQQYEEQTGRRSVRPSGRHISPSAANTSAACPLGFTRSKTFAILPRSSMMKVVRRIPWYFRPYMLFSPQAP